MGKLFYKILNIINVVIINMYISLLLLLLLLLFKFYRCRNNLIYENIFITLKFIN